MKPLVIIGAGGHARETKFLIDDINRVTSEYNFLGYLVSDLTKLTEMDSKDEIIGDLSWIEDKDYTIYVVLGIGTPKYRLKVADEIRKKYNNVVFPTPFKPITPTCSPIFQVNEILLKIDFTCPEYNLTPIPT